MIVEVFKVQHSPTQPTWSSMRGIRSYAAYIPYRRLERSDVAAVFGGASGRGQRAVASFDEDTTTMGFEAARLAMRSVGGASPDALWFATAEPAYPRRPTPPRSTPRYASINGGGHGRERRGTFRGRSVSCR